MAKETPIKLIKIDVVGAELLVLKGAVNLIRQNKPMIIFESGPGGAEAFGYHRMELFEFIVRVLGCEVFLPKDFLKKQTPLTGEDFDKSHIYPFGGFNYVAIPSRE